MTCTQYPTLQHCQRAVPPESGGALARRGGGRTPRVSPQLLCLGYISYECGLECAPCGVR